MLSYKKIATTSLLKMKDKRVFLAAFISFLPVLINLIVSSIILKGLILSINSILQEFYLLAYDETAVITSETVNLYANKIIDSLIVNIKPITISLIVSAVIFIINSLLTYVYQYIAYMVTNREDINKSIFFNSLLGGIWLSFIYSIKIFLWSLLLIVPGIIKSYSYSLCFFIKIENPDMKAKDCIKKSQQLMKGRKERLFIQSLLFILICVLVSFILSMVLSFLSFLSFGSIIYSIVENFIYSLLFIYWLINIAVYYDEIKKDEKWLEENPEMREKGITGRLEKEQRRMHFSAGPFSYSKPQYKTEEERKIYDGNPFSKDNNKNDDPFED